MKNLAEKVLTFSDLCQLNNFCDPVQLHYIGTSTHDSQKILADISLALSSLKIISYHGGRNIPFTPDDLFSRYTKFLPLLSPNIITWSFSLVTLFVNALHLELQEAVQL